MQRVPRSAPIWINRKRSKIGGAVGKQWKGIGREAKETKREGASAIQVNLGNINEE